MHAPIRRASLLVLAAALLAPPTASPCTTFRLRAQDGAVVVGRSMELGQLLDSRVMVVPRGFPLSTLTSDGKPGWGWTGRYGFVGMNAWGQDVATDGMNEAGLSVGALYIPGFVEYQPLPRTPGAPTVSNLHLVNWMLSLFATVEEVRAALPGIVVYDLAIPGLVTSQPLHWAVSDAKGGAIVVEYVGGGLHVYDNPVGTLTNSPNFEWHQTNLRNFVNLTNVNVDPLRLGTTVVPPIGQGTGLLGLPGDYTPPSRFVKATALAWSARPQPTATDAVNAAFHVLNAVDIPLGAIAQPVPAADGKPASIFYELTQWATVHDLANRALYYRTYGDLTIRKVDLRRLDLSGKAITHVPMPTTMHAVDVTAEAR